MVRTALTAIFLLFVGVVFSTLGITFVFTLGINDALPFLIIGGICQYRDTPCAADDLSTRTVSHLTLPLRSCRPALTPSTAFIPGSYASFILYHAWKGTPGYSYDQIPSHEP